MNETLTEQTIKTQSYGIPGAGAFQMLTIEKIGMRGGEFVDQVTINSQSYGGGGGAASPSITLAEGEYVNQVSVIARPESYVSYLEFTTNKGQSIKAGTKSIEPTVLSDIKLLGVVGFSGWYINQIEFIYEDLS